MMAEKTYIVLLAQAAEGCGYSIACGKDHKIVKSELDRDSFIRQQVLEALFHDDDVDLEHYSEINMDNFVSVLKVVDLAEGKIYDVNMEEQAQKYTEYFEHRDTEDEDKAEIELLKKLQAKHGHKL